MTDDSNARVVATVKAGAGFEAPWIVFRADTPEEMRELLDMAAPLYDAVATASAAFRAARPDSAAAEIQGQLGGVKTAEQPGPFAGNPASGYGQPQQAAPLPPTQAAPNDPRAFCEQHKVSRQYKEGTNKAGKPYKGFFCPSRGCAPQWV